MKRTRKFKILFWLIDCISTYGKTFCQPSFFLASLTFPHYLPIHLSGTSSVSAGHMTRCSPCHSRIPASTLTSTVQSWTSTAPSGMFLCQPTAHGTLESCGVMAAVFLVISTAAWEWWVHNLIFYQSVWTVIGSRLYRPINFWPSFQYVELSHDNGYQTESGVW